MNIKIKISFCFILLQFTPICGILGFNQLDLINFYQFCKSTFIQLRVILVSTILITES